jgi:hypothetical protein
MNRGAISVYDQMIVNSGDNTYNGKPLFRGAIMNSGSIVPAVDVAHPKAQAVYDVVVNAAGCSGSSDTLACLRSVDYDTFMRAADVSNNILLLQRVLIYPLVCAWTFQLPVRVFGIPSPT